jgi:hypothetical protein
MSWTTTPGRAPAAGLGDVDDDRLARALEGRPVEDGLRTRRGGDDDVGLGDRRRRGVEWDPLRGDVDVLGDGRGVGDRPVGDDEAADPRRGEGAGREGAHLAGADDQARRSLDGHLGGREVDRRGPQRDAPVVYRRLRPCALADAERLRQHRFQRRPEAADAAGVLDGPAELPEDLVLAHDQRLQARRHPHEVADALLVAHVDDRAVPDLGGEPAEGRPAGGRRLADDVRLRAVAGGDGERLRHPVVGEEVLDDRPGVGGAGGADLVDAGVGVRDAHAGDDARVAPVSGHRRHLQSSFGSRALPLAER